MFDLDGWTVAVLGFDEVLDPLDAVAGAAQARNGRGARLLARWCER